MATIKVDSELMTTLVPAVPVPASHDFKILTDSNGQPMVLSLGNDGFLYLIVASGEGQSGSHQLLDVSASLGLKPGQDNVVAYDVIQSTKTHNVYMVVAVESPALMTLSFASLIVPQPVNLDPVKAIYLGSPDIDQQSYPGVILSYASSDHLRSEAIVGLKLSSDLATWTLNKELKLAENADKILDICAATLGRDKGIFVLYSIQGSLSIEFAATERLRHSSITCPQGATRILPVFTADGHSDLIVAGHGLTYFKSSDLAFTGAQGTTISNDPVFQDVRDLDVSVNTTGDATVSVFASNSELALAYVTTSIKSIGKVVPTTVSLLPAGMGGYFSSYIASNGNHSLICSSTDSSLVQFEQASDTLLWKESPYNVASLEKNLDVSCYQTRITLVDSQATALAYAVATLQSSGSVFLTVNGKQMVLDDQGRDVTVDQTGAITIVCPTADIAAYTYTISNITTSDGKSVDGSLDIDPAQKAHDKMTKLLSSPDDLKKIVPQDGSVSDDDMKNIPQGMRQILKARGEIAPRSNIDSAPQLMPIAKTAMASGIVILAASGPDTDWAQQAEHALWSAWMWVERQAEKAAAWALRAVDGVRDFVICLEGKIMRFVIDTVANISKALSWMWNKLKVAWNKMIDFFGFLFSWDDIIECKNSTEDFINAALTACEGRVDSIAQKVDDWFIGMEKKLQNVTLPPELANSSNAPSGSSDSASTSSSDSAGGGWTQYQLQHGGALKQSKVDPGDGTPSPDSDLSNLFKKYIGSIADSLQNTAHDIGSKLTMLFDSNRSVSTGKILEAIGSDILVGILDLIRAFVVDLIHLGADILRGIQDMLNYKIQMPVFSAFYEKISGRPCTVLDILSLIIAIPITLTSKIITQKNPPLLPKIDADTYNKMADGKSDLSAADQLKFNQMSASIGLGAISLQTICDIVEIAGSAVPIAGGIALKVGGFPVDGKLILGIVGRAAAFPAYKPIPGIEVAVSIWGCATLATFVRAAIRKVQSAIKDSGAGTADDYAQEKFLAGLEVVLAVVSVGLFATESGLEYAADPNQYPTWHKDQAETTYKLTGSVLSQVGTIGTAVAIIVDEPITKTAAGVVSGVAGAASYLVLAARHYRALGNGQYAGAISHI